MPVQPTIRYVTVPNYWDLDAVPAVIRSSAYGWHTHAEGIKSITDEVNELAASVVGCSWQGPASEAYMKRRGGICEDAMEAVGLARQVSDCIDEIAQVTLSIQEQLDQAWLRLRRRVRAEKLGPDLVRYALSTQSDLAVMERGLMTAQEIQHDGVRRLEQIDMTLRSDVLPRLYRLLDGLTKINDGGSAWTQPDDAYGTTVVRIGDTVYITRGVSALDDPYNVGDDTVTMTTDPVTGEKIVTINGVEQRFGKDANVVVRDGLGLAANQPPVASYSPSPGIHVDRVGDQIRVTARLELSGDGASEAKALEIEQRIRDEWTGRFPDGSSIATDVQVAFRPPGQAESPDATQILLAHIGKRATHVEGDTNRMVLNLDGQDMMKAVHHEFGHQIGLRDRYTEPLISKLGNHWFEWDRWGFGVEPGYEHNVMNNNEHVGAQNLHDLGAENTPTQSTDDDQIREWASRRGEADLPGLATNTKIRMVGTLMDGWISDEDVTALEVICRTARPGEQASALREAITARLGGMWGSGQRARVRAALDAMP